MKTGIIFKREALSKMWSTVDSADMVKDVLNRTILHGPHTVEPLKSIEQGILFKTIRQGWEDLKLEEGSGLQRSAWPQILSGQDCFLFGPKNSGKSLAYLAPLCAMIQRDLDGWKEKQSSGIGPLAIILTHDTYSSIKIEHHAQTLLSSLSTNQIQCSAITEHSSKNSNICSKGVEIIVTTPDIFENKVNKFAWFKLDRLLCMVIDDVDWILCNKKGMVKHVLETYNSAFERSVWKSFPQIIVCGVVWSKDVEELFWNMPRRSTIIIGNPKASIAYSGFLCTVHYVEEPHKASQLSNLLDKRCLNPFYNRVIIVCGSDKSCWDAYQAIANRGRYQVQVSSKLNQDKLKELRCQWENASSCECIVMIVTDEVLRFFEVRNANYLIHYDVEDFSQGATINRGSTFYKRFSCLWIYARNISEETDGKIFRKKRAVSDIFISTNESDLDRIVKSFESIGISIPKPVSMSASKVKRLREMELPLCESLKLTGVCDLQALGLCKHRHTIKSNELTEKPTIPGSGQVEMRITKCTAVNSYVAQLLRYFPMEKGKCEENILEEFKRRQKILDEVFEINHSLVLPERIAVGTMCAVRDSSKAFCRGKITQILTRLHDGSPNFVRVFCVDTGEHVIKKAQSELSKLPDCLSDLSYLTVQVILVGVLPPNKALEYSSNHLTFAKSLLIDNVYKAEITMSIDNTIWVTAMKPATGENLYNSVRQELIARNCASLNLFHEHWIWSITSWSLKILSDKFFVTNFYNDKTEYSWAFPTCEPKKPKSEIISLTFMRDPWTLYGNLLQYVDLLNDLEDDIQRETENLIGSRYKDYEESFINYYTVGTVALFLDENSWRRCIIIEKTEKGEMHNEWGELLKKQSYTVFSVMLVDYGDIIKGIKTKSLFPILRKLIKRLPFQAIHFSLRHIIPINEVWESDSSIDYLVEWLGRIAPSKNTIYQVQAATLKKGDSELGYPLYQYNALLFTMTAPYDELGELLVKRNFAKYANGGLPLIQTIRRRFTSPQHRNELDDEDTSIWDLFIPEDVESFISSCFTNGETLNISKDQKNDQQKQNTQYQPKITEKPYGVEMKTPQIIGVENKNDKFLHPLTRWLQKPDEIVLTIELPDIKDYTFTVGEDRLISFRSSDPPNYGFDIHTFGYLCSEKKHLTGQCLQIKLKKCVPGNVWPTILRNPISLPWLKMDYSALPVEDESVLGVAEDDSSDGEIYYEENEPSGEISD